MTLHKVTRADAPSEDEALSSIAALAVPADQDRRSLAGDMYRLSQCGLLGALSRAGDPVQQATILRRIGRASLSVGRLAEGHMNAMKLILLYGTQAQVYRYSLEARQGMVFGVWGADDDPPVTVAADTGERLRLSGGKRFASGLGTVSRAVVTAGQAEGVRLAVADVTDAGRADAAAWDTSGMRATRSGRYDFDGITADALGAPGDYLREPHFQGGVWRYAAVQTGGLEALAEEVRQAVRAGGDPGEARLHRLARIVSLAHRARLLVEDAARQAEAPGAGAMAVALSLAAREEVETACLEGIALADRALGTRSFARGHRAEMIRRDLGFFLRQADLDGKLRMVGDTLCKADVPVGEIWSGR
ncbi:MAG: acyl-CoA dehydrogenase family protein [Roseovarius sp.]|uniref:acyl-CoA dehydrogenase family protein n=1 Tax=Roseovarius sp. TaxID=1486281 RepID=UPI0032EB4B14